MDEAEAIRQRYDRRLARQVSGRYSTISPSVYMAYQEWQRAIIRWITAFNIEPLPSRRLLEVGCGSGVNLIDFLRLGFSASNLFGNELLQERVVEARSKFTEKQIIEGDFLKADFRNVSFDVVYLGTVLSSILDPTVQQKMADKIWSLLAPGGGVLVYDFVYNNPMNPDVQAVPISRIRALFGAAKVTSWRITLAPPISRLVTRLHPSMYTLLNSTIIMRTHALSWVRAS